MQIKQTMENFYPFTIGDEDSLPIMAEVEMLPEYMELFGQYDYEPNGYCWQGHIVQILEKVNPDLLSHVEFDPEAGGFFAFADSTHYQLDFVKTLSPIFQDIDQLASYIASADRNRIDN